LGLFYFRREPSINHGLELLEREVSAKRPAKYINIVILKLVQEFSVLYKESQITRRCVQAVEADREKFVVVYLDTGKLADCD
jgi:DNA repair protein RadC